MKFLVFLACLACTVFASLKEDREQWIPFKSKHGKLYRNLKEEQLRFSIFQQNLREIKEHNNQYDAGKTTYTKEINHFADLTKQEFVDLLKRQSTGRSNLKTNSVYQKPVDAKVPKSIDWREKGAVSEVKDQGDCGSCWAFSVTGSLESFNFLKNHKMVTFSEQQLIDCFEDADGCSGGDEGPALGYVVEYGIQTEESYPYKEDDSQCHYNESAVVLKIEDYMQIKRGNEDDLLTAVAFNGPISVALDASQIGFYKTGVFTSNNCSEEYTNHAVLAVGYGKDQGTGLDYWLIKNSWGKEWGDNGYFKIKRGDNECAIATDCVYPVL